MKDDVLQAIDDLRRELREQPERIENRKLDDYLEAMHAWISDSTQTSVDQPSWELVAQILRAAAIYE